MPILGYREIDDSRMDKKFLRTNIAITPPNTTPAVFATMSQYSNIRTPDHPWRNSRLIPMQTKLTLMIVRIRHVG